MLDSARTGWHSGAWDLVLRLGATDGSASHRHVAALGAPGAAHRDLADAVHALCAVHGHHPGVAAEAHRHCAQPDACAWLEAIAGAFTAERAYIAALVGAAGPLPSTPGQAQSEAALIGERHALEMLARSDRCGCATGAVAALVHDWAAIRTVLDRAAERFGIDVPPPAFPLEAETATSVAMLGAGPAAERAVTFGAQQLLAQHRGLWDLLEARSEAREG